MYPDIFYFRADKTIHSKLNESNLNRNNLTQSWKFVLHSNQNSTDFTSSNAKIHKIRKLKNPFYYLDIQTGGYIKVQHDHDRYKNTQKMEIVAIPDE